MRNNFDADAVDDVVCDGIPTLTADCITCPCCEYCCSDDSADEKDPFCNFDLDFYKLTGLECGAWWASCKDARYD
eukprot:CAMPEP_0172305192 /NCGR_PEP_ID=MMETSP1058-20130122/6532_1 /TAXON_ID=83371 /ORGANISM="Detonula confervacea, Strain CCMP 353" /LENGTH=74 /DNA_ID=CAMNT_0013016715 /DNA_START=26 /DNA_END=247 /DNA_ORIENTATION=-